MTRSLRLGSRQSELALVQANHTVSLIHQLFPDVLVEVVPIVTTGDRNVSIPLDEMGGKGVFIKELEQALLDERIDLAIHCLKDVTVASEYGLDYAGFLAVDFIPDVLVANQPISLEQECIIGTSSKRRQALLKHYCPSFQCKPIRGNIPTRLQKLREGDYDALVLSEASLRRLNIEDYWEYVFPLSHFIPAPGQGVLACQIRFDDDRIRQIVDAISDPHQTLISRFEYSLMKALSFNCNLPFGLYTSPKNNQYHVSVFMADDSISTHLFTGYTFDKLNDAAIAHIANDLLDWQKSI